MENLILNDIKLKEVNINDIEILDKGHRKKIFDHALTLSIERFGLINAITLCLNDTDKEKKYILISGLRRLEAYKALNKYSTEVSIKIKTEKIPALIYNSKLKEEIILNIKKHENTQRENLTLIEETNLVVSIHNMYKKYYKEKNERWSSDNTGEIFNKSGRYVRRALQISDALKQYPELKKLKHKNEILKFIVSENKKKEIESKIYINPTNKKIINSYITNDFFKSANKIQKESIDLCEIDLPLPIKNKDSNDFCVDKYNEIYPNEYIYLLDKTLKYVHPLMKENSWLIVWFYNEPFFEDVYKTIINNKFMTHRLCGLWHRINSKITFKPKTRLKNSYEMFFYVRKGNPKLNMTHRSNSFIYAPVSTDKKIHVNERPLTLMQNILKTFVPEKSMVLVPFAGSGVTIYAAYKNKMNCVGYEINEKYKPFFINKVNNEWCYEKE